MTIERKKLFSSFRDPGGFLFYHENKLYRQINYDCKDDYNHLIDSGLYKFLTEKNWLIPHEEKSLTKDFSPDFDSNAYIIIRPELIPFISYPYEWTFSQLKDAALLTLRINKASLKHSMILKDASAFNIQFRDGLPVFIDTLSFTKYEEGQPWIAYRQFCKHFLAPLALMSYVDIYFNQWFRIELDGVPLDLASRLLPKKTKFKFGLLSHIHLHAKAEKKHAAAGKKFTKKISKFSLTAILENLESTIRKLTWNIKKFEWSEYYDFTNYTKASFEEKRDFVSRSIDKLKSEGKIKSVWDIGANTGEFSKIPAEEKILTISFDKDLSCIEKNYLENCKEENNGYILPIYLDLTSPSPNLGWNLRERDSIIKRAPMKNCIMALALIHHLAISNNVPLDDIAKLFSEFGEQLIIEFVPKEDSQVQKLLATREDIFQAYHESGFEKAFRIYYHIVEKKKLSSSQRVMYLMRKRDS
jgi:hypothetical protein